MSGGPNSPDRNYESDERVDVPYQRLPSITDLMLQDGYVPCPAKEAGSATRVLVRFGLTTANSYVSSFNTLLGLELDSGKFEVSSVVPDPRSHVHDARIAANSYVIINCEPGFAGVVRDVCRKHFSSVTPDRISFYRNS